MEILLPLLFVVVMIPLSGLFQTTISPAAAHVSPIDGAATILPLHGLPGALAGSRQRLAVLGTSGSGRAAADAFVSDLSSLYQAFDGSTFGGSGFVTPGLRALVMPGMASVITTFPDEASMEAYVQDVAYGDVSHPILYGAVVFNSGPPGWDYTVRLNTSNVPSPAGVVVNTFANTYSGFSLSQYIGSMGLPGFLSLQLAVDRFVLGSNVSLAQLDDQAAVDTVGQAISIGADYRTASAFYSEVAALDWTSPQGQAILGACKAYSASESRAPQQVDFVPFPTPEYKRNLFYSAVLPNLTLFFIIAWVYPVSQLIRGLVLEKELRLREVLKQMGAGDGDLWGSWLLTYAALYGVTCIIVAGVASRFLPSSDPGVLFALFYTYSLASCSWGFLVSVFFTRSRTASVLGGLTWLAGYFATFGLNADSSSVIRQAAGLLAPTSLSMAMEVISGLETNGVGATRTTAITAVVNNWTVGASIGMMVLDTLLYALLAWYLDQVLPSWAREYGVPRPWYFPVSPAYWREVCGGRPATAGQGRGVVDWGTGKGRNPALAQSKDQSLLAGQPEDSSTSSSSAPAHMLQAYDPSLQALEDAGRCVQVKGLRKEFHGPQGVKVAVDGVSVSFFEGQVTCLLGHNGAGKTTTLGVLAGLIPASSGSASAFGVDMLADQAGLRKMLGVCPQHDVLWPDLTVLEHLRLFAAIKGVKPSEVEAECRKALDLVGLADKSSAQVKQLSGGMKRKLSLVLAFLGGSKVVFLDEPTSGVDPYSRRAMWNIIQQQKEGRVVILTTHFMDEADILGDRIAIMHGGRLHCAGTPVFLKQAFGVGYTCSMVKTATGAADNEVLLAVVREHVPEAKIGSAAGSELLLQLPLSSSPRFPALLRSLSARSAELRLVDVGIIVTSLEDVFLRVAQEGSVTHAIGAGAVGKGGTLTDRPASGTSTTVLNPLTGAKTGSDVEDTTGQDVPLAIGAASSAASNGRAFVVQSRGSLFWPHVRAILLKRLNIGKRDYRTMFCMMVLPLLLLIVGFASLLSALAANTSSYVMTTSQFNTAPRVGPGRPGPDSSGAAAFSPQYPNYIPTFGFKSTTLADVDCPGLGEVIAAIPTANASMDGGRLLVTSGQAGAIPDPYNFTTGIPASQQPMLDYARMSAFLLNNANSYAASKYGADVFTANGTVLPGQQLNATVPKDASMTVGIFVNTTARHAAPIFLNLLDIGLLRRLAGITGGDAAGPSITTRSATLPLTYFQKARLLAALSVISLQPLLIALAIVPAACAYFVVREREVAAKHQQTISGVSIPAYWLGNFVFDTLAAIIPVLSFMATLAGYGVTSLIGMDRAAAGATFLLLMGFAASSTSFTYLLAHAFKSPSNAQAAVVMLNLITLAVVQASGVLSAIPSTCSAYPGVHYGLGLLPFYAVGNGLNAVTSMDSYVKLKQNCDISNGRPAGPTIATPTSALALDVSGQSLLYLAVETVLFLLLTIAIDVARSDMATLAKCRHAAGRMGLGCLFGPTSSSTNGVAAAVLDPDVAREQARVDEQTDGGTSAAVGRLNAVRVATAAQAGYGSTQDPSSSSTPSTGRDPILISHLRKVYGTGKVAVQGLAFGVPAGQVFGFLGNNGAGKTSSLQMLTGALLPTSGTAVLGGHDIIREQKAVRRLLGYCPQFDALLDLLTVREHLQLYGRIKGVPESLLPSLVSSSLRDMDLVQYEHALAGTLSGGNKRKLSVAVALMGSPPIVFLDEPSTGMDPVAKRFMWRVISRVATEQKQCSIILTTHSMEEGEALCTRIGIMVSGQLRCLGSPQHLRSVHGSGLTAELRLGQPDQSATAAITAILASLANSTTGVAMLPGTAIPAACDALRRPDRAAQIHPGGHGWALAAALSSPPAPGQPAALPLADFIAWWLEEDGADAVVGHFITDPAAFPGSHVKQRQGRSVKLEVPASAVAGLALADMFERLEGMRTRFNLESATLSQTTLEQVFNNMAAADAH